jgi:hypothetical protein
MRITFGSGSKIKFPSSIDYETKEAFTLCAIEMKPKNGQTKNSGTTLAIETAYPRQTIQEPNQV